MASIASSQVPHLSLCTFRRRNSVVCQRTKIWPLYIKNRGVCDTKLSFSVKTSWDFSRHCALGTVSSAGSSETEKVERCKTPLDRGSEEQGGFERELDELLNEVKSMISKGNRDEAKDLLQANHEAVKERIDSGEKGIEEAALLDVVALGFMALGELKLVESLLGTMTEVVESLSNDEKLLDPILIHMGSMYANLRKFAKSELAYQRAIDIMENKFGKDSGFLVIPYMGIAKSLSSTGKATKAREFYNRSISILESTRGKDSEELIVPLRGLGNLLLQQLKGKDAETPLRRILDISTKLYGKSDRRVGMAMCSLGRAICLTGNVDEAISLHRNALQVIKDSNYTALDDGITEKIRTDLADLLHAVGRVKEGRQFLEECLVINEELKGKDHPSSATYMVNLATSHLKSKNYAEAEHLLRSSLKIIANTVGTEDQAITFPMLHLAVTLYHLRRDEEAEQIALEVLRVREKAFGKDALPVAEALDCLVSIQTRLDRDEEALLEKMKRVLKIQERDFGDESEEVLETLKKLEFYFDKLGKKADKLSIQKRLLRLRMKFKQRIPY